MNRRRARLVQHSGSWLDLDNATGTAMPLAGAVGWPARMAGGAYRVARISSGKRKGQAVEVTLRSAAEGIRAMVAVDRRS